MGTVKGRYGDHGPAKDRAQGVRTHPTALPRTLGNHRAAVLVSACSAQSALPTPGASSAPGAPTVAATTAATTASTAPGVATTAVATVAPASSATARAGSASATSAVRTGAAKQEAPLLAEAVKAGKLPALVERMPKNPLVVNPVEKVGKYGGTWRAALLGVPIPSGSRARLAMSIGSAGTRSGSSFCRMSPSPSRLPPMPRPTPSSSAKGCASRMVSRSPPTISCSGTRIFSSIRS
jgi:hypothetical protein